MQGRDQSGSLMVFAAGTCRGLTRLFMDKLHNFLYYNYIYG